jgi:hypothetical protein
MAQDESTATSEKSAQTTTHRIIFLQFMIEFLSSSESPTAARPTNHKLPARPFNSRSRRGQMVKSIDYTGLLELNF